MHHPSPVLPVAAGVAATARAAPGRVALIDRGCAVTYAALDRQVGRMAAWLLRQGLQPGEMAGVTLRGDVAHLVASLALMRLGCGQVTLASHEPALLRAETAARLGAVAVIGDMREDALPGLGLLLPGEAALDDRLDGVPLPAVRSGEALVVLTSSGTTGRPKLIPLTEADIALQASGRRHEGAVQYRALSTEHNNGKKYRLAVLALGGTALLPGGIALPGLAEACTRFAVDCVTLPPQRASDLAELHAARRATAPWPARTAVAIVGSVVGPDLRRRVQAVLTPRLRVTYATTECGGATQAMPDDHARHPDGVGRALPGVAIAIVDDRGRALPAGETGLIRLRTPGMARRYLDDEAATARAFRDGWFQPGDMGRLEPDGTLVFAGRDAEMMILGTLNVFPAEIERAAEGFPGVMACAAFPLASAALGDIPAIAVVESAPGAVDLAGLVAHCRARLGLRAPRRAVVVAELPRNAGGKVLRDRLARDWVGR
jgi:acyl-CoA synthetase (AMP-forming)/AMP-acid ligase II